MKSRRQFMTSLAVGLSLPALWARAKVLTCPKCNYEVQEGDAVCAHCQTPLQAAATPEPGPVAETPKAVAGSRLTVETVRQIESLARQAAERGDTAAALILGRQAAALALAAGVPERIAALDTSDRALSDALRQDVQTCPVCRGKGHRLMLYSNFAGEVNEQIVPNLRCPGCGGRGTVRRLISSERLAAQMSNGQRTADAALRVLHYTDLGGVWVPQDRADALTPRDLAALRGSIARRCATCTGSGVFGCKTCNGSGRAKCSGAGCVMGQAPCPDCAGKRRVSAAENGRTVQQSCRTCNMTGVVNCPVCTGRGWESCLKCKGSGDENCPVCQGRGQPALCVKCTGRGLTECRTCKGTGEVRGAPCLACHGSKEMLCTTCRGSGRKKR